jgi:proline dehydrogenase
VTDVEALRETALTLRIVKGEWADCLGDPADGSGAYLDLVRVLAGRQAPVAIATHDPLLAAQALDLLIAAGTPCLLEQLRGLPRRRSVAVARARGVPCGFICRPGRAGGPMPSTRRWRGPTCPVGTGGI